MLVDPDTPFGCFGCLQCMATCQEGAISVSGRAVEPEDLIPLPAADGSPSMKQLEALFLRRRSIRKFRSSEVERDKLERIIEFCTMAPMGIPPSDVQVEVFATREQVRELARDNLESTTQALPYLRLYTSWIGRLMLGRLGWEQFKGFVYPLGLYMASEWKQGRDKLFYDAPAALYFHGTEWVDPQDVGIVLTYAMLAAEAQGLGTCIIGSLHPFMVHNRKLCEKYGVPPSHKTGVVLIVGYPAVDYHHAIRRRLGRVRWRDGKS